MKAIKIDQIDQKYQW